MTDSSTGGYIVPRTGAGTPPEPLEDAALDAFLHDLLAGITGMDVTLVRPRWQAEPPNLPEGDWAAFGILDRHSFIFPQVEHDGALAAGDGGDVLYVHEYFDLLASFYGPNCQRNGARLRDGLAIAQNQEALIANGFALGFVGDLTRAPVIQKGKWAGRADLALEIRRQITRHYPVLNILSAEAELFAGPADVQINTNP